MVLLHDYLEGVNKPRVIMADSWEASSSEFGALVVVTMTSLMQ